MKDKHRNTPPLWAFLTGNFIGPGKRTLYTLHKTVQKPNHSPAHRRTKHFKEMRSRKPVKHSQTEYARIKGKRIGRWLKNHQATDKVPNHLYNAMRPSDRRNMV